jgi:hypothetical protein
VVEQIQNFVCSLSGELERAMGETHRHGEEGGSRKRPTA